MSKFQVGDKVRWTKEGHEYEVVGLADYEDGCNVWCGVGGKGWIYLREDDLEHVYPHVPDVDGNPIRVGQLVEQVDAKRVGWAKWVSDHHPDYPQPQFADRPHVGVQFDDFTDPVPIKSSHLRLVSLTFRPPEPDTRDVTLRVTVPTDPRLPSDVVMREVDEALHRFYDRGQGVTVEVVDDVEHDDG